MGISSEKHHFPGQVQIAGRNGPKLREPDMVSEVGCENKSTEGGPNDEEPFVPSELPTASPALLTESGNLADIPDDVLSQQNGQRTAEYVEHALAHKNTGEASAVPDNFPSPGNASKLSASSANATPTGRRLMGKGRKDPDSDDDDAVSEYSRTRSKRSVGRKLFKGTGSQWT